MMRRLLSMIGARLLWVVVCAVLATPLVSCAPTRTAIDPGQCRAILDRGGTSAAYTQCLLDQAKDKSVGGMPVLSDRARSQLDNRRDDPCLAGDAVTQNDYLACELSRPSHPASSKEPRSGAGQVSPLPLIVEPTQ
ncbi:MAG: hypothetical protein ACM3O6_05165 [Acidobacteriota bacterium]